LGGLRPPPSLLIAVSNATARPSTASVPIFFILFDAAQIIAFALKGVKDIKDHVPYGIE